MKTKETALLEDLVQAGKVAWQLESVRGGSIVRPGELPWKARCVIASSGQTLIELKLGGNLYSVEGSDVVTGKDLREIPRPYCHSEVEIPMHYLRDLG